jgi:transcriptional regulator with XRE-family HTH domain
VQFGAAIGRVRLARGWTLVSLGKTIGMHPRYLGVVEAGGNDASLTTIVAICQAPRGRHRRSHVHGNMRILGVSVATYASDFASGKPLPTRRGNDNRTSDPGAQEEVNASGASLAARRRRPLRRRRLFGRCAGSNRDVTGDRRVDDDGQSSRLRICRGTGRAAARPVISRIRLTSNDALEFVFSYAPFCQRCTLEKRTTVPLP